MNSKRFLAVGLFLACLAALAAGRVVRNNLAGVPQGGGHPRQAREVREVPTPIGDGAMTPRQREHGKLYKGMRYSHGKRIPELLNGEGEVTVWGAISEVPLTRLPLGRSLTRLKCEADAVIVGSVAAKSSNLTESGTFIFTDYEVTVEEVLKDNPRAPVASGGGITVTRPGGSVSIRGRVVRALDREVERLEVGQRYLLYLKFVAATGSYGQVSQPMFADAFLLHEGGIEQTSDKPLPLGHNQTADAATFLAEARQALNSPCAAGGER